MTAKRLGIALLILFLATPLLVWVYNLAMSS
jgi:hypothetical protein